MESYNTNDLELASSFQPFEGEANFGPTITREVVGGSHIAPHCITVSKGNWVLVDWNEGLPRHDQPGTHTVRFPHGLLRFGESFEACAMRLVSEQIGMKVASSKVVHVYSSLDDMNHWHIEPIIITKLLGEPSPPDGASIIFDPVGTSMPPFWKWWVDSKEPFQATFEKHILPNI